MKMINLLPKSEQKETELLFFGQTQTKFWVSVVLTLLIFCGAVFAARFYLNSMHKQISSQILEKQKELQTADNETLKTEVEGLNQQIRVIRGLQTQHQYWSNAFAELGNLFTSDMELNLISADRATGKVDVVGSAQSRDSVLAFWSALHKSEYFKDINFPLSNLERATDSSFSFSFYINEEKIKQETR